MKTNRGYIILGLIIAFTLFSNSLLTLTCGTKPPP